MLTSSQTTIKRIFDIILSVVLLPFASILLLLLFIPATFSTGKPALFVQQRVGRYGRIFPLYKIRTLKGDVHEDIRVIDASVTPFGSWLRRTKLDELPQLFNVLKGDMSWVGPRPDVPGYADRLQGEDRIILSVRPGITGPATLKYRNEDTLLLRQSNPKEYNDTVIWPDKVAINKAYIANWSFKKDVAYLWRSVF
jgi:lipopolysaccharide/colanic/teichoic acid biosynthesis glycosyltransferase